MKNGSYPVRIGSNLLNEAGNYCLGVGLAGRCAIISDTNVAPLFADRLQQSLKTAGFEPVLITVPAGEQAKTLQQAEQVCERMLEEHLDRQSFVIGLGGGVVGDLSGFIAAIFQRGIPHLQIPTTLLAMVDSSIGGKTGVNARLGKNMIGAVHHPRAVVDDIDVLENLPPRELTQGFAEIIKHAIIADAKMFQLLSQDAALKLDCLKQSSLRANDALISLIRRNVGIKAKIIAKDEQDRTGERALLNFGHTVAHGIERAANYRDIFHGEAVSLGIVAAASVSVKRASLSPGERDAIVDLLSKFELPTRLPKDFPRDKILESLQFDKKFEHGQVRFVVTPKIGSARLSRDITLNDIRQVVEEL